MLFCFNYYAQELIVLFYAAQWLFINRSGIYDCIIRILHKVLDLIGMCDILVFVLTVVTFIVL